MAYGQDVQIDNRKLPSNSTSLPVYLSKQYRDSLGALVEFSEDERKKICNRLKKELENYYQDTSELRNRLQDWNDRAENIVHDTDNPWPGCSNVSIPLIPTFIKVFHSVECRSILGADNIWFIETDEEGLMDSVPEIEAELNYNARSVWNISDCFRDVFYATNRDGLSAMQVPYVEEYEPNQKDILVIVSLQHFLEEFPDPQSAGLSEQGWQEFYNEAMNASEDDPLIIPVVFDKCVYRGPKGEVVELADFIIFPATAKDISKRDCRGYGKSYPLRKGMVRQMRDEGLWYKDSCNKFLKWSKKGSEQDSLTASKDWIEGVGRGDSADDHRFQEVVYWMPQRAGKPERKMLLTYHLESNTLMAAIDYPYRVDFYALFRIEKRPNRLLGVGIPASLMDIADIVDTSFNQRINSRTISHVPSFKMARSVSNYLDMNAEENRFKPGVVFYLNDQDFDKFEQWKIQPVDMGESQAEEKNLFSICDLYMGSATSLLSGKVDPKDANAPGNKTAMLIGQSNARMEDPLSELRYGVEKVGEICASHQYQFGPAMIKYVVDMGQGRKEIKYMSKAILRKGLKFKMQGITVLLNPEQEFQKWYGYYQAAIADPAIAQDTPRRLDMLRMAYRQGRVPNWDRYIPTAEEAQMQQVQQTKMALQQMMAERQQQQMKMAQDRAKQEMQQAQDVVKRKALAQKMAEQNLAFSKNGKEAAA